MHRTCTGAAAAADIDGLHRRAIVASTSGASAAHLDERGVAGPEAKHAGASQAEILADGVVNLQARSLAGGRSSIGADGDTRVHGLVQEKEIGRKRQVRDYLEERKHHSHGLEIDFDGK